MSGVLIALLIGSTAAPGSADHHSVDTIPVPDAITVARTNGTRDAAGRLGPRYWQAWPRYELNARLEPDRGLVVGSGSVVFQNPGEEAIKEVVLRLDQNRFRAGVSRDVTTAGIEITALQIQGDQVALDGTSVVGLESTVAVVALERALSPGDSVRVDVEWTLEVPEDTRGLALRQGRIGTSVFQVAQWYPRLAMYDDLGGWDKAPHVPSLEFYNPFADFDVRIAVPAGWLVGATGALENAQHVLSESGWSRLRSAGQRDTTLMVVGADETSRGTSLESGYQTWHFRADSVSDFAWGASPEYSWAVTSITHAEGRRLLVHALMVNEDSGALARLTQETGELIADFSSLIIPYAWSQHSLVGGPDGAMEYPQLTMSKGSASAHESAHQWFPMLVGSDETRFVFMDEGLATFLASAIHPTWEPSDDGGRAIPEPLLLGNDLRVVRPTAEWGYWRGAEMMEALAVEFGTDRVLSALAEYAREWRFAHPTAWDFMASIETSLGRDLDDFWLEWLFNEERVPGG